MLIDKVRELPDKLEHAVKGLDDAQLNTPYGEDTWTVRQAVHHIGDWSMNAFLRFKWTYTEDFPNIKTYNQQTWATTAEYNLPVEHSLLLIRGLHVRWAALMESFTYDEWRRKKANHPEIGTISLDRMLRMYADHGEKYCGRILYLRAKMGW